jgi:tetratricopeptide (TPR) repeat protein
MPGNFGVAMFPRRVLAFALWPFLAISAAVAQYCQPARLPGGVRPGPQTGGRATAQGYTSWFVDEAPTSQSSVTVTELRISSKIRKVAANAERALLRHDPRKAEKLADEALRSQPEYARALVVKAILRVNEGKVEDGIALVQRAIASDHEFPEAYVALGAAYNLLRKYAAAREALTAALRLAPEMWQAHLEMSKVLLAFAHFEEGLKELDRTEELDHQHTPETCLLKGWALMKLQRYAESRGELKEFLKLAPESSQAAPARQWLAQMPQEEELASGK